MQAHMRRLLGGLVVGTVLALGLTTAASARNFSVTSQGFRIRWTALEFRVEMSNVRCPVVMEGNLHTATFVKSAGSLIGYITRGIVTRPCVGGTVWAFNGTEENEILRFRLGTSLPWHVTYEGFTGTLPNPTGVRTLLSEAAFIVRASILGIVTLCTYRTGVVGGGNAGGVFNLGAGGAVTGYELDATRVINSSSGGICPQLRMGGVGAVTKLINNEAIEFRLI